eukprot:5954208-Alexandrium_andersonii.AAC.1
MVAARSSTAEHGWPELAAAGWTWPAGFRWPGLSRASRRLAEAGWRWLGPARAGWSWVKLARVSWGWLQLL